MELKEKVMELEKIIEQKLSDFESDTGFNIAYIYRSRTDNIIRLCIILDK